MNTDGKKPTEASELQDHMNTIESRLLAALGALNACVGPRPAGSPPPDVRPHLAELDRLTRELPSHADPELLHYLHRRSYDKARLYLEGRMAEIQKGGCLRSSG